MTPEKQVIKSMLSFCEGFETDGSLHQDTVKLLTKLIGERIRTDCEIYGVELDEPLPFQSTIQIGYASAKTLCEDIKHNAVNDGIATTASHITPEFTSLLNTLTTK